MLRSTIALYQRRIALFASLVVDDVFVRTHVLVVVVVVVSGDAAAAAASQIASWMHGDSSWVSYRAPYVGVGIHFVAASDRAKVLIGVDNGYQAVLPFALLFEQYSCVLLVMLKLMLMSISISMPMLVPREEYEEYLSSMKIVIFSSILSFLRYFELFRVWSFLDLLVVAGLQPKKSRRCLSDLVVYLDAILPSFL